MAEIIKPEFPGGAPQSMGLVINIPQLGELITNLQKQQASLDKLVGGLEKLLSQLSEGDDEDNGEKPEATVKPSPLRRSEMCKNMSDDE